jgi:hypothetical protein
MKVEIYWNLHKNVWSIRHKGKVVQHANRAVVKNAKFVVQEGGRQRVLRECRKNAHAFVRGELVWTDKDPRPMLFTTSEDEAVSYNPYKGPSFFMKTTGEDIVDAPIVLLGEKMLYV